VSFEQGDPQTRQACREMRSFNLSPVKEKVEKAMAKRQGN
jgi:hypothetical protein